MPSLLDIRDPLSAGASTVSFFFGSAIILIAITSATVRALQQGLQPEREVERYQQYRSALQAMRRQFEAAPSASEKIEVMQRMEHIAFDEMRNFLLTNQRSSFAM
jgi:hypothetical protein